MESGSKFLACLKYVSVGGAPAYISYNRRRLYKSLFGGVITIICISIILIYSLIIFYDILKRNNAYISDEIQMSEDLSIDIIEYMKYLNL